MAAGLVVGKNTFPNRLIAMVISAVTGSPCLVKIRMPEPIMLIPTNVAIPKTKTISVPKTLTLRITPKKVYADQKVNYYYACAPDKAPNRTTDNKSC